jgi:hypothetical protein
MVSYKRHLAKTVSWRVIGTLDTIILSGIITGSWEMGMAIGGIELITKINPYLYHSNLIYLNIYNKIDL